MPTIREIVDDLVMEGYRITARTVKYYIDAGLIPIPDKEGGYKEGVRLVFKNGKVAKDRIKRIYELKGKGYKLSEISEALIEEDKTKYFHRTTEWLGNFVEREGKFFFTIESEDERIDKVDSIASLMADPANRARGEYLLNRLNGSPSKIDFMRNDFIEIEKRNLVTPINLVKNKASYEISTFSAGVDYILLHRRYDLSWDTIEALHKQNARNFDKYIALPEIDNKRFTREWLGWYRQYELNKFGIYALQYLDRMADGFARKGSTRLLRYWDSVYEDVDTFVSEFLEGKCAFLYGLGTGPCKEESGVFLRRIPLFSGNNKQ